MGHPNTKKHKAQHGGYRDKPSKKEVMANLSFWGQIDDVVITTLTSDIPETGEQLQLF